MVDNINKKIEEALQAIRPNIQMDGGDIEFVSYSSGIVELRFLGACVNCPMSIYTLKLGIEEQLKESVPGITEVKAIF